MITSFSYTHFRLAYSQVIQKDPIPLESAILILKSINDTKLATQRDLQKIQALVREMKESLHKQENQSREAVAHYVALSLIGTKETSHELFAIAYSLCEQILKKEVESEALLNYFKECLKEKNGADRFLNEFEMIVSDPSNVDQKVLIEIAYLLVEYQPIGPFETLPSISRKIHLFGIKDQDFLFSIAKKEIVKGRLAANELAKEIKQYNFSDPKKLRELAFLIARTDSGELGSHLHDFNIEDERTIVEISKIYIEDRSIEFIHNFFRNLSKTTIRFKDPQISQEMALTLSKKPKEVSSYIHLFNLTPDILTQIALVQLEGEYNFLKCLCGKIDSYQIQDQEVLKEIAVTIVKKCPNLILENIEKFKIEDQSFLKELAKIILDDSPMNMNFTLRTIEMFLESFSKFNFKQDEIIKEILELAINIYNKSILECVRNLNIRDEEISFHLATLEINNNKWKPENFAKYINTLGLKNKTLINQLAISMSIKRGEQTGPFIKEWLQLGWLDESSLKTLACLDFQKSTSTAFLFQFFKYFPDFNIKDLAFTKKMIKDCFALPFPRSSIVQELKTFGFEEEFFLELAELQVKQGGTALEEVCKYILDYGFFKNKKMYRKFIKFLVDEDACGVFSIYIGKFNIKDPNFLKEIALQMVEKPSVEAARNLAWNIKSYEISDSNFKKVLIQKLVDRKINISDTIDNFEIEDCQFLFEIAEQQINNGNFGVIDNFENYKIKDEKILKNYIRLLARYTNISNVIDKFDIKDEEFLIELAFENLNSSIKAGRYPLTEFAENFKKFNIKNQDVIKKIALAVSKHIAISTCIESFDIKDENFRFQLAKNEFFIYPKRFNKFKITNPEFLKEFAREVAERLPISPFMYCFRVYDEEFSIELATNELNKTADHRAKLIEYLNNYNITNEKVLISLAKLLSRTHSLAVHIRNFRITDEKVLYELAMQETFKGRKECEDVAIFFGNYQLKNREYILPIARRIIANFPNTAITYFKNFGLNEELDRLNLFIECCKSSQALINFDNFNLPESFKSCIPNRDSSIPAQFEFLKDIFHEKLPEFDVLLNQIDVGNVALLTFANFWLTLTCLQIQIHNPPSIDPIIWAHIFVCRDHQLCADLTENAIAIFTDSNKTIRFKEMITSSDGKPLDHMILPALFFANQPITEEVHELVERIKKDKLYKDQIVVQNLAKSLFHLSEDKRLSKEAMMILARTISMEGPKAASKAVNEKIKANLYMLQGITAFGGLPLLKAVSGQKDIDFNKIYEVVFKTAIPLKERPDFLERYMKTFGSHPNHFAILTYAGRLSKLDEKEKNEIFKYLAFFVDSVLSGDYKKVRYEGSVHLNEVFKKRNDLAISWPKNGEQPLCQSPIFAKEGLKENIPDYFRTKLLKDEDLDLNDYPELKKYLESEDESEKSEIKKRLVEISKEISKKERLQAQEIDTRMKTKEEIEKSDDEIIRERYRFQMDLINFIDKDVASVADLNKILARLNKLPKTAKFIEDVELLKKQIEKALHSFPKELEGYTLVSTDDPLDIFFIGKEGYTCQRFDGDPEKNKCLLAYLLDGKCRLIAVKNKEGRIVARSIVRLLIDASTGEPALFQEKVYHSTSVEVFAAFENFIKDEAKRLKLSLYQSYAPSGDVNLVSRGTTVPYEYVDSADGVRPKGIYVIRNLAPVYEQVAPTHFLGLTPAG